MQGSPDESTRLPGEGSTLEGHNRRTPARLRWQYQDSRDHGGRDIPPRSPACLPLPAPACRSRLPILQPTSVERPANRPLFREKTGESAPPSLQLPLESLAVDSRPSLQDRPALRTAPVHRQKQKGAGRAVPFPEQSSFLRLL